jgi:hypothetical protein
MIVFYVYKKLIIIIEHRSSNFKCVKGMDSQISNLITHDNMICSQNWDLQSSQVQNLSFFKDHANYSIFHM